MNKILTVLVFFISMQFTLNAQLNDYKYIVVPVKFNTFKNPNQFKTSTLIKYKMAQEGFNVIYDDALPLELQENRCLGLFTDLLNESSFFKTKASLVLKDCKGEVIFKTSQGQTKTKELDKAYKEVITEACVSFKGLEHNYQVSPPASKKETITVSFKDDVKQIEDKSIVDTTIVKKAVSEVINKTLTDGEVDKNNITEAAKKDLKDWLYAKATKNGFELLDQGGDLKYSLEETSIENVFLVNQDNINGVVLKKDEKWYLEHNGNTGKVVKELFIKF
ncbi:hypothetical protein [Croceitalea rosinachiae]|uniref:Uncharacterized protein n=1 Tax=Croceitalea rosinachiae TaxID=3075596 RepID=A0ABU3AEH9_9FLAO|nr:hypothetical protein [Croceitalea sp. F388]MDT0607922.1 hypothetical protein [Croceitalea sp. F388]